MPGEFDHTDSAQQRLGSDDEGWGDLLVAIRTAFGDRTFTTRHLTDRMERAPGGFADEISRALLDALPGELHDRYLRAHESPHAITRSLGKWLKNRNGRWAGQLVCEDAGQATHDNVPLWRIRTYGA